MEIHKYVVQGLPLVTPLKVLVAWVVHVLLWLCRASFTGPVAHGKIRPLQTPETHPEWAYARTHSGSVSGSLNTKQVGPFNGDNGST